VGQYYYCSPNNRKSGTDKFRHVFKKYSSLKQGSEPFRLLNSRMGFTKVTTSKLSLNLLRAVGAQYA